MSIFKDVKRWHEEMGLPVNKFDFWNEEFQDRATAILAEEFAETLAALTGRRIRILAEYAGSTTEIGFSGPPAALEDEPEAFLDGCQDSIFVIAGRIAELGWDGDGAWEEVCRSNFTKKGASKNEKGKLQKGSNFSPPDLKPFIK